MKLPNNAPKINKLSAALVGAALTLGGYPAFAQSDDESLEEIVITGSRITRRDFVSASPLVTAEMEAVANSGRVTVDDYLRDLPQFGPGSGDYSNDSNGGTAGRATLNLRNLGAKRNLVLMDGRRLLSSGTDGAIDINTIPSLAIGNIEVITGGASATYGSDALSGVVNFKTRTDLDGFDIDTQFLSLDDVGEDSYKIGIAYGTDYADGRGNLLVTAERTDRGGVRYFERDFFNINPQASSFTAYGSDRLLPRGNLLSANNDGTVFNATNTNSPTGANGTTFNGAVELPLLIDGRGHLRTHGQYRNWIQVPLEQDTFFVKTDYELDNGVTAYGQVLYASSTAFNVGAEPISAGIWGITIPEDNFFVQQIPDIASRVRPGGLTGYQRRFVELGNRVYNTENDVTQFLGGLKGSMENRDLNWDVHISYGETDTTDRTISGALNFAAVQEIIDTTDPATGANTVCSGAFNPFGGFSPFSGDCLDYAARSPVNSTELEQTVIEGLLEGKLADMPAGEARFALNAQYRENTYTFNPDPDIAAAELANLASAGFTTGEIEALEVAGEVFLPLVSGGEAFDSVNLTMGLRLADYDPAGSNETYKIELDAQVNENLMLRGGFQHAVRSPNVEEFFRASLLRVQGFLDPCSSRYRGVSVDRAAELALCAVQGADPSYTQGGSSAPTFTNGNPNLVPEEADTFTIGAVWDFDIGETNVQMSLDYYNIEIEKAIETLSAQLIMTKCFNLDGTSNPSYDNNYFPCQQINRPIQAGQTTAFDLDPVNQPILNLGGIKTSGFDFTASFEIPVEALAWGNGEGSLGFRSLINVLDKHEIQAFSDERFIDFAGVVSPGEAYPELKMFNSVDVRTGPLTITGVWRHISDMDDISAAGGTATTIEGADSYDYFDLTARMNINEQFEVYGGVINATDEDPPQLGGEATGSVFSATNQGVYDGIGRAFYIGVRGSF
jgi:iron complex outermembrane receptor protein